MAREDPERPANALIEPLMLAVLAQRSGHWPATMTVGTDLGRRSHAWVDIWHAPMMVLPAGAPSGKAGFPCKRFLKAFISLFTSVWKMWVRISRSGVGYLTVTTTHYKGGSLDFVVLTTSRNPRRYKRVFLVAIYHAPLAFCAIGAVWYRFQPGYSCFILPLPAQVNFLQKSVFLQNVGAFQEHERV